VIRGFFLQQDYRKTAAKAGCSFPNSVAPPKSSCQNKFNFFLKNVAWEYLTDVCKSTSFPQHTCSCRGAAGTLHVGITTHTDKTKVFKGSTEHPLSAYSQYVSLSCFWSFEEATAAFSCSILKALADMLIVGILLWSAGVCPCQQMLQVCATGTRIWIQVTY
jgi:hypothetical protein